MGPPLPPEKDRAPPPSPGTFSQTQGRSATASRPASGVPLLALEARAGRRYLSQRLKAQAVARVVENQMMARGVMSFGTSVWGRLPIMASIL